MATPLVLGPMLRYTDETTAAVWVEVERAAQVTVRIAGAEWSARTWRVHDHHYALVEIEGLTPGSQSAYEVLIDDMVV
ncbi:hypothetical protein [Microbacterium sp. C7(2022)]|uniref:DUF7800 domain-containing protein n=1 Tax=Microbacterium sp. C7(2022) TaxID=2992759 RepID=UPI0027D248D3|nr:hypothetical protein [Microbacterium sp. C7(2022)]